MDPARWQRAEWITCPFSRFDHATLSVSFTRFTCSLNNESRACCRRSAFVFKMTAVRHAKVNTYFNYTPTHIHSICQFVLCASISCFRFTRWLSTSGLSSRVELRLVDYLCRRRFVTSPDVIF